jgi:hypothetical protein
MDYSRRFGADLGPAAVGEYGVVFELLLEVRQERVFDPRHWAGAELIVQVPAGPAYRAWPGRLTDPAPKVRRCRCGTGLTVPSLSDVPSAPAIAVRLGLLVLP